MNTTDWVSVLACCSTITNQNQRKGHVPTHAHDHTLAYFWLSCIPWSNLNYEYVLRNKNRTVTGKEKRKTPSISTINIWIASRCYFEGYKFPLSCNNNKNSMKTNYTHLYTHLFMSVFKLIKHRICQFWQLKLWEIIYAYF